MADVTEIVVSEMMNKGNRVCTAVLSVFVPFSWMHRVSVSVAVFMWTVLTEEHPWVWMLLALLMVGPSAFFLQCHFLRLHTFHAILPNLQCNQSRHSLKSAPP